MPNVVKWIARLAAILAIVLLGLAAIAALWPVPTDPLPAAQEYGAGSSSVEPSYSGLQRQFPPLNEPPDNPTTPAKAELGRLLFFDPILSANQDISCATCHHVDYGFADGLPRAVGAGGSGVGPDRNGGVQLTRNTPSLWNVGYAAALFWDGRADSLEEQALVPLTHADEMAMEDLDDVVARLNAIPAYVALFDQAFGGGAVTVANVTRALAAFERTLISAASPFDRYAAGEFEALTPSQRRGLALFRSAATRCFECHPAPTFATNTFRVIGVPDAPGLPHDPGRAAVAPDGQAGAFKTPSLRNVALTAPYMHNGIFQTLEEVIDFYAQGGGRAHGVANVDPFVLGFELTQQERADLAAFLYALTDESALPQVPDSAPSGLPIAPRLENPARQVVNRLTAGPVVSQAAPRQPTTWVVQPGETIQSAVDRAQPGDVIEAPYGVYHERVVVDVSRITLRGVANEQGQWPILDGQGELADGVIASGNGFEMANFHVRNYNDNGVLVEGVTDVYLHDLLTENVGTYGIYPVQSSDVLIERVEATGVNDAGIYAGQCQRVIIRNSVAHDNVIGIEVENTVGAEVYDNHVYDNAAGIFVDLLPQLTSKVSLDTRVYGNLTENNNHANFAPENAVAALIPSGLGVFILAADGVEVFDNVIRNNKTAGVALFNLAAGFGEDEIDVGPNPERNRIHGNLLENNGYAADPIVTEMGIAGADLLWDGTGWDNRFDQPGASAFPPLLPTSRWPAPLYRVYWRALNLLVGLMT